MKNKFLRHCRSMHAAQYDIIYQEHYGGNSIKSLLIGIKQKETDKSLLQSSYSNEVFKRDVKRSIIGKRI